MCTLERASAAAVLLVFMAGPCCKLRARRCLQAQDRCRLPASAAAPARLSRTRTCGKVSAPVQLSLVAAQSPTFHLLQHAWRQPQLKPAQWRAPTYAAASTGGSPAMPRLRPTECLCSLRAPQWQRQRQPPRRRSRCRACSWCAWLASTTGPPCPRPRHLGWQLRRQPLAAACRPMRTCCFRSPMACLCKPRWRSCGPTQVRGLGGGCRLPARQAACGGDACMQPALCACMQLDPFPRSRPAGAMLTHCCVGATLLPSAAVAVAEPVGIYKTARVSTDSYFAESLRSSGMWHLRKVSAGCCGCADRR